MDENYFDFGVPISFGYIAQYLSQKTVTRRDWKDSHASKFIKAFERAKADGKKLRVPAIDKAYHAGGKQIGWLILNGVPYKEALKNMPHVDLVAEGGMCSTVEEFVTKYFKGDLEKEVWVIGFQFLSKVIQTSVALDSHDIDHWTLWEKEQCSWLKNAKWCVHQGKNKRIEAFLPGTKTLRLEGMKPGIEYCQIWEVSEPTYDFTGIPLPVCSSLSSPYKLITTETPSCLELSNSSAESVVSDLDLNQSGDSNSIKPSKSAQAREQCTRITLPTLQSGTTCERFAHPLDNSTASLAAAPAKTLADAEKSKDLTAIDLLSGGRCCESSMNANPLSSAGKMLRERCTEELEKLLPLSEWSDTKLKVQSLYRQRSLEPHISEKGFSLLPTATTYPSGNTKISSAGRNKLESTLRSLVPTPRANDGSQGYSSGKTGGINLTGYLLATPQNANSPTLPGNLKGDRLATPSARDFKERSPIKPTESANPQVWGWMMGFPKNWCESVLMPQIGLLESVDQDGGKKVRHKLLDCQENEFKGDEIQSTTTELLASPTKPSPSPSESDTCPILKTTLQVMTSSKSDEHGTPHFLAYAARELLGKIDLDPMSNSTAQKVIRATTFYTKKEDGLTKPWIGKIWLNPAFSLADEAVAKLIEAYEVGICSEALLLIKAAPETKRDQSLADYPFCELSKRVKFISKDNRTQAPFSTLIFYLGKNFSRFKEVFSGLGNIRLGRNQVDELENDRRELLTKVAQLELALAKKCEFGSDRESPDPIDWLDRDLTQEIGISESRLKELEIDREVLPDDIYLRQRIEWQARLQALRYTQEAIAKISTRFTDEYQEIINRDHPQIESEENYAPDFAPGKWAESFPGAGSLLIRVENYRYTSSVGWIAECNVRNNDHVMCNTTSTDGITERNIRRSDHVKCNSTFLIKAKELFKDFRPWDGKNKEERAIEPIYSLGSIRTTKDLKSHFTGLKLPTQPRPESTEIKAPDGSIWQACKDGWSERAAIKWRCEVLPDGFSRSPRIDNKKAAASTAAYQTANNINYSYDC